MKKTLQQKQEQITQQIIKAFKDQFGQHLQPIEFETMWPITCWDLLHTSDRTFSVKLKLSTGKIEKIEEEF